MNNGPGESNVINPKGGMMARAREVGKVGGGGGGGGDERPSAKVDKFVNLLDFSLWIAVR